MFTKRCVAFLFFFSIFFTPTVSSVLASHSIKLPPTSTNELPAPPVELPDIQIVKGTVKKGDTISSLLNNYLPLKTIYALDRQSADIFAWDIDFIRDIQPGDRFQVLVEKRYREGKLAGYGKIQAAVFINKGNRFDAFLHKDANGVSGYYDRKGNSLQKAFLKAPLAFSRISSKFSAKRLHPIKRILQTRNLYRLVWPGNIGPRPWIP